MTIDWDGGTGRRLIRRLESDHLVWFTTVGRDGAPRPSLVWFWWSGAEVLVYSKESPRITNLASNPRAALNFNSDDAGGSVATLTGTARVERGHPSAGDHRGYLDKYRGRIEDGLKMSVSDFTTSYSVPVLFTPEAGQAW